ncbi:MAG: RDD family protein [Candidatus Dojkabacteria bacterium]|nr:RDD family protein [Candidatus Dojkabacteria bacterium]
MYCSKCGNKVPKDSKYCSKCGTKISKKEDIPKIVVEVEETHSVASLNKRFVHFIFDYFIVCQIILPLLIIIMSDYVNEYVLYTLSLALPFLYFFIFETTTGKTLGKLITKTEVVNEDGIRPNIGRIFIRTLCRFIPFDGLSVLFGKAWHDSISKTYVIES